MVQFSIQSEVVKSQQHFTISPVVLCKLGLILNSIFTKHAQDNSFLNETLK